MMQINLDMARFNALPLRLKLVAAVIALDLLLLAVAAFFEDQELHERQAAVGQLRGQVAQLRRQSADLRQQLARYPELLAHFKGASEKGLLQKRDAEKLVEAVTDFSAIHQVQNLHYRLEAEDIKPDPKARYLLGSTIVSLEGGSVLDGDALAFWDEVLGSLPAHYRVTEATIEKVREVSPQVLADLRAGRPVPLVHAKLSLRWSSLQRVGEGP
jgi:hypothetical protein